MQTLNLIEISDKSSSILNNAKPFLKWAGGKTQLLDELYKRLPSSLIQSGEIERYVEPFVGGGAFFFFLKRNFKFKESFLIDINKELIIGYKVIQNNVNELIDELSSMEEKYLKLSEEQRKDFYYNIRDEYNRQKDNFDYVNYNLDWVKRAADLIFLNKTCFNGLYRLNKKGEFNVPFGKYKNPTICDADNLIEVSKALENTEVICADFEESKKYIHKNTLVYLDPPYRPLNNTSNFTSYNENGFDDDDQRRLAQFFKEMDKKGAYLILSNSDPKNEDVDDNFFDELYAGFIIERVKAKRYINSNGDKRGDISELIIRNYE
ncbi:MAG: DNA adenine methylase [Caldanaerobacter subterraneus]|uniref:Site-specific DNA-methyltransferase (adenine-specific) n=1 Tax=Thermoanaerobacter brockii subsp. finnii (strain ATCC 43586 / DSM 3389 / AKO-1) TaxID=509193 RepID=E8UWA6_THEBF|nr:MULTISPECIES: DNA adenine methylase [Thermoanaerobacter]KUJ89750.1 MAG: DNA adenine methylase [Thermoanaerobacter thermocopriae]KUK35280.1 MAG: DNA adenine methylase [Caldanaerobacter subterraneus]ADV80357.1 DNA adenine methylase [Thermoanaerobacter brockii subsp. finnii Ako-1]HAA64035.1 DNA adenine methylase [Thermoanaerobacter sp.]HAA80608.1 DNA adenine methylase [Thermoanaerobacter sp.]